LIISQDLFDRLHKQLRKQITEKFEAEVGDALYWQLNNKIDEQFYEPISIQLWYDVEYE
jgi:hypothetical protein